MALINCKECGNEVSSKAKACPKCGASVPKGPNRLLLWGIGLTGLAAIGAMSAGNSPTQTPTQQIASTAPIKCTGFTNIGSPQSAADRFQVEIAAAAQGDPHKPLIVGKSNLPVGTNLMISLERPESAYKAESKATVRQDGCFSGGPFTQSTDAINSGQYNIDVLMPVSGVQPDSVQKVIGNRGQNIVGPLVHKFQRLGKIAEFKTLYTVGIADTAKDAEAKQKGEAEAKERQAQLRSSMVVLIARNLRENLRNPSSADWVSVLANDDASVVCIVLRAQNGFGGMTVDSYAFVDGKGSENTAVWNKRCAGKTLHDLTSTVHWAL